MQRQDLPNNDWREQTFDNQVLIHWLRISSGVQIPHHFELRFRPELLISTPAGISCRRGGPPPMKPTTCSATVATMSSRSAARRDSAHRSMRRSRSTLAIRARAAPKNRQQTRCEPEQCPPRRIDQRDG